MKTFTINIHLNHSPSCFFTVSSMFMEPSIPHLTLCYMPSKCSYISWWAFFFLPPVVLIFECLDGSLNCVLLFCRHCILQNKTCHFNAFVIACAYEMDFIMFCFAEKNRRGSVFICMCFCFHFFLSQFCLQPILLP